MWSKLLSGRFLFTIIAALVFAVMSVSGQLPSDKVFEIILVVVYAYFSKADKKDDTRGTK